MTFQMLLTLNGTSPRVAMELMRHSDMKLTMKTYTDVGLLPTSAAIRDLPSLGQRGRNEHTAEHTRLRHDGSPSVANWRDWRNR